jgi:hypothetical protein
MLGFWEASFWLVVSRQDVRVSWGTRRHVLTCFAFAQRQSHDIAGLWEKPNASLFLQARSSLVVEAVGDLAH